MFVDTDKETSASEIASPIVAHDDTGFPAVIVFARLAQRPLVVPFSLRDSCANAHNVYFSTEFLTILLKVWDWWVLDQGFYMEGLVDTCLRSTREKKPFQVLVRGY
ncbi:hypothetical protein PoB_001228600 [Plakobranchus ocellatus]|uniref:DDE Tnp4 domain-containing protein n=1 Tax=Plakobranchus ocellatus TaxID=259542 RepID=A0AAV3YTT9_9GAST|nr:hypothetical protein PoB_001228600 [Plakobranchus ocellatus]